MNERDSGPKFTHLRKQVAYVAVLPPCCEPVSPGSIPGPGTVCSFCFQSKLASIGFSVGSPEFSSLHLKQVFISLYLSLVQRAFSEKQCLYTEYGYYPL